MTTEEEYNGFTNYQTWAVNLWIMNDEGLYGYWMDEVHRCKSISDLAALLKDWLDENNPVHTPGIYGDLMSEALSSVNCFEIAGVLFEGAKND